MADHLKRPLLRIFSSKEPPTSRAGFHINYGPSSFVQDAADWGAVLLYDGVAFIDTIAINSYAKYFLEADFEDRSFIRSKRLCYRQMTKSLIIYSDFLREVEYFKGKNSTPR